MPAISLPSDEPSLTTTLPIRKHKFKTPKIRLHLDDISHDGSSVFLSNIKGNEDLEQQVQNVLNLLYDHDTPQPGTRSVTFVLRAYQGLAYTTGIELDEDHKEIHINLDYIAKLKGEPRHEILGVICHELVHCFQWAAEGTCNGGLIEGVADYVRLNAGLAAKHWRQEANGKWDGGYQHTGYFLQYLEERFGAGTIKRLNQGLREGQYDEKKLFGGCCSGKEVEQLWKDYGEELARRKGSDEQPSKTEEGKTIPTDTPPKFDYSNHREALLVGDYNVYRTQLSRQLLAIRKRLGRATAKKEKFAKKEISASDVGSNLEFVHLLLLTAERAWAHAMFMKTSHGEDMSGKGITGSTRSHIISRLSKAAKTAGQLVELLNDRGISKANDQDVLEARAYRSSLAGAEEFEKQSEGQRDPEQSNDQRWQPCLRNYAEARVIYAALYERDRKEVYRDILANTIDPTIRYAAYQAHLSRTIAIPTIAKRYFPSEDKELVSLVEQVDQYALQDKPVPKNDEDKQASPQDVPNSVTWRGRKANIVDASIGQALAAVTAAEARLRSYLTSNETASNRDKAAAYDDVLTASQDAADATKRATDELEKERVDEGDPRMQDLRVTSLAVNYDLISWRVGRNRILIGDDDGLSFTALQPKKPKRPRKDGRPYPEKEEPRSRKLARLRERVVLYDATIQSVNSVKDLRGAMRDAAFVTELEGKEAYFRALKCLNISYSHSLLDGHLNALALLQRANELLSDLSPSDAAASDAPPTLHLTTPTAEAAQKHISALLSRTHALVELHELEANARVAAEKNMTSAFPLVQNLNAYPTPGVQVDPTNLVQYPPKVQPVPVKPLFLDVAWNYIDYPGREKEVPVKAAAAPADEPMVNGGQEEQPKKRGWFGFGR
ncbi:signal recognition particle subunit srp68 [Elasticomyces elasticus]|uniref:Signal recognition particle subunit SRP68 n=1 Tax=Elasticomyces elasticus TaxID=574655 RepID=A0AAN7VT48_9PEZI|nr:signal recognition particle subunit srp68 [Elasticomyces elasticus]